MSVRDPSRRKALKYGAIAALGLGVGVALGDVTGADRLVHAASPSGSDPVFSGTGIQFPSLTSDPSQLVGNMWYRSDLTAMKYSDGTNAHELAALDIANTWTGVQTFNANPVLASGIGITWGGTTGNIGSATAYPATVYANALTAEGTTPAMTGFSLAGTYNIGGVPTLTATLALNGQTLSGASTFTGVPNFNGGIVFNAAGSIASTNTFIEADGSGNLNFNVPAGVAFIFNIDGARQLILDNSQLFPQTDNSFVLGKSTGRWQSVNSVAFDVYGTSGDANPSAQLANGAVNFGAGGSSSLSTSLVWVSGGLQFNQIFKQYNGINTVGLGLPPIYGSGLLVSIGTTSTTIASYTPTSATGQHFNVKWVLSAAAATTPTLTVSWTDPKAGAQSVTLFSSAMAANSVQSGVYPLVATSAAAITVSASALVAADIFGTATVSQEQ